METFFSVENLKCMIDLHLHLDGAISIDSAKKLARLQKINIPENDEELANLIQVSDDCNDLNEFLERFDFPCSLLQTKEGVQMSIINLAQELKEQGVMYAEVKFAPQLLTQKALTQEEVVIASIEAAHQACIPINLILCCMRGENNHAENMETAKLAVKYYNKGVVALDLAGAEALFATEKFSEEFKYAKTHNIQYTIHAGEAAGPESVKAALAFEPMRIGHGVRSVEDRDLMRELSSKQVPLELCPTSNLKTAIYPSIAEYPIKKLLAEGLLLTINTDDPAIEATTIKKEYDKLIKTFNFSKEDIKQFLLNAAKVSFASDDLKAKLVCQIEQEFN